MTDISKAIRSNLIEQFIIPQPSWRSGGAASPQVGPGQHLGGDPGSKALRNFRNLALSGYQIEAKFKTALIERIVTSCLYFFLTTNDYFHLNQWR